MVKEKFILNRYGPGEISKEALDEILNFLFPRVFYQTDKDWKKELQIYNKYVPNSTIFTVTQGDTIVGSIRCVLKRNRKERLPVEAGAVVEVLTDAWLIKRGHINGLCPIDSRLPGRTRRPSVELSGLQISTTNLSSIKSYAVLTKLFNACEEEALRMGCELAFLTCADSAPLLRLYKNKCRFKELATVTYDKGATVWVALFKVFFAELAIFNKKSIAIK